MPRRRRQSKRTGAALTLSRFMALTLGPNPQGDEDDRVLAAVWSHHRERLLEDEPRPWGFWYFEPEVPEELREERPALVPVDDGQAIRQQEEDLEAARREWLVERDIADLEHIGA